MRDEPDVPLIVHIIFRLDVGGLENGLVNLINQVPEDRYRQAIICLDDFTKFRERIRSPNVQVFALHKRAGKDLGVYVRAWRLLRRLHPAIVHTRNLGTVDMVFPALMAGVRCRIHGEHGWDMIDLHGKNKKYLRLRRICRPFISRYIAVSRDLANWLIAVVHAAPTKVASICNGVDSDRFIPARNGAAGRRRVPFETKDALVIGTVGRAVQVKDQVTLIKAFAKVVAEAPDLRSRLRLAIIGDGPELAPLRQAAAKQGIAELAWIPGRQDSIEDVLREFDIFVLPSLNEGISNTILEAMASGLPVIATDVGGNPELVDDRETGFLVPVGDIAGFAQRIRQYVADRELRLHHSRNAREKIERQFSLNAMVDRYLAVYDDLLAGS